MANDSVITTNTQASEPSDSELLVMLTNGLWYKWRVHPEDMALTDTRGYLVSLVPCKPLPGSPCTRAIHWHTYDIQYMGFPWKNGLGQFVSPYRLFDLLKKRALLPELANDETRRKRNEQPIIKGAVSIQYPAPYQTKEEYEKAQGQDSQVKEALRLAKKLQETAQAFNDTINSYVDGDYWVTNYDDDKRREMQAAIEELETALTELIGEEDSYGL